MTDNHKLLITPQTKVGELLEAYPQLEAVLIEIAPPFKKLRNPVLRRTVAKVTSLAQAARVGGVSVADVVGRLREAVGQPAFIAPHAEISSGLIPSTAPEWMADCRIVATLDARPMIEAGEQPIGRVLRELDRLQPGQVFELITPFEPAPLIDKAAERGYRVWTTATAAGEYRTYFVRG
jgi:uncharacterized protein (DUF2249 family)